MTASGAPIAVFGASGQDGSYLVRHLQAQGHEVVAVGRDIARAVPTNWRLLGLDTGIARVDLDYYDAAAVEAFVQWVRPRAVHLLAGQSSVRQSHQQPAETIRSHTIPLLNAIEAVRRHSPRTHVVHASSTDCFGSFAGTRDETAPFAPTSPYAAAKVAASTIIRTYRDSYGLAASNAFLSNHESVLRPGQFLFGKILSGIAEILQGERHEIETGSLGVERDWGLAAEFVEALALLGQRNRGMDVIVATGHTVLLRDAVHSLMRAFALDPAAHIRENGHPPGAGAVADRQRWDVSLAARELGWTATTAFPALAEQLRHDWLAHVGRPGVTA